MPPIVYNHPIKRPGFITSARWLGDDDDLALQLKYENLQGGTASFSLDTKNAERNGNVCLPNSNDILQLGAYHDDGEHLVLGDHTYSGDVRDILAAHLRMATLIHGHSVPGSVEFQDAVLDHLEANHFQTALGTTKISDVTVLDDSLVALQCRQGTGPKRWFLFDYGELQNYTYVPQTQLYIVAGAIEKQYGSYTHDHPNQVLTQTQKDNIADYVVTLAPWV